MSPTPHPTTRIGARSTLPQQAIGGLGTRQSGGSMVDIDGFSLFSLCGGGCWLTAFAAGSSAVEHRVSATAIPELVSFIPSVDHQSSTSSVEGGPGPVTSLRGVVDCLHHP
jgi:hypothetical protein